MGLAKADWLTKEVKAGTVLWHYFIIAGFGVYG